MIALASPCPVSQVLQDFLFECEWFHLSFMPLTLQALSWYWGLPEDLFSDSTATYQRTFCTVSFLQLEGKLLFLGRKQTCKNLLSFSWHGNQKQWICSKMLSVGVMKINCFSWPCILWLTPQPLSLTSTDNWSLLINTFSGLPIYTVFIALILKEVLLFLSIYVFINKRVRNY